MSTRQDLINESGLKGRIAHESRRFLGPIDLPDIASDHLAARKLLSVGRERRIELHAEGAHVLRYRLQESAWSAGWVADDVVETQV